MYAILSRLFKLPFLLVSKRKTWTVVQARSIVDFESVGRLPSDPALYRGGPQSLELLRNQIDGD